METKKCTKCGEVKALGEYYKKLNKRQSRCIECVKKYNAEGIKKTHHLNLEIYKVCKKCGVEKQGYDFLKSKYMLNGLSSNCKDCGALSQKLRKYNGVIPKVICIDCNTEIVGKTQSAKRCDNCVKILKSSHTNPNMKIWYKEYNKKKYAENPDYYKEKYAKYGANENKKRRIKYHSDPEFRAKKLDQYNKRAAEGYYRDWYQKNKVKENERSIRWRNNNRALANALSAKWRLNNLDKCRAKERHNHEVLTDNRVCIMIRGLKYPGLLMSDIPKELIEQKRLQILINRELKKQKSCQNQLTK